MANVLLIVLLIISVILTFLILIQRSEGGALGIGGGGGGGGGGLMSGRGTADLVTKMTTVFGVAFMAVCVLISISFNYQDRDRSIIDDTNAQEELLQNEETTNQPLITDPISANDTTPLAGETSQDATEETPPADTEDKPQGN